MNTVGSSDIGKKRVRNEDSFRFGQCEDGVVWAVVCDGMGGAAGGNIASALAVKVISEKITSAYNERMRDASIKNLLDSAIAAANIEVYDLAYSRSDLNGMGTTVVAVIVRDNIAYIAHAGDSRAYLVSKDDVKQITVDHSLVQNLVDRGEITPEEAERHPKKNLITRALGVDKRIDVDFSEVDLCENETLILCTDGLSNCVNNKEISEDSKDGQYYAFADRLVKRANKNGGNDNITVVAIAI